MVPHIEDRLTTHEANFQPFRRTLNLLLLLAACFVVFSQQHTVFTTAPIVTSDLANMRYLPLMTVYGAAIVVAAPLWRFLSFFGRKKILFLSCFFMVVGTLLGSSAFTIYAGLWISVARAIAGIGAGGILRATMTYISELVKPSHQINCFTLTWILSLFVSPLCGSLITDNLSWRYQFYISAGAIFLIVMIMLVSLPQTPLTEEMRGERVWRFWLLDWCGLIILASYSTCFSLVFFFGGQSLDWNRGGMIAAIFFGLFLVTVFFFVEVYHSYEPLMPVVLFSRCRNYFLAAAITFLFGFVFCSVMHYIPLYLQVEYEFSSTKSTYYLWAAIIPFCLVSLLSAFMPKSKSITAWSLKGFFLLAILGASIISATGLNNNLSYLIGGSVVFGIGSAGLQMPMMLALAAVKEEFTLKDDRQQVEIVAPLIFAMFLGSTFGVTATGAAIFTSWANGLSKAVASSSALVALSTFDIGSGDLFDLSSISTFADVSQSALRSTFSAAFRTGMIVLSCMSMLLFLLSLLLSHTTPSKSIRMQSSSYKEKEVTILGDAKSNIDLISPKPTDIEIAQ